MSAFFARNFQTPGFDQMNHLGSFRVLLRYPSLTAWARNPAYFCHFFNAGSLWINSQNRADGLLDQVGDVNGNK
jgi:hypothetical protein